ncbi:hypothetical protein LIA77_04760 [Sarocladium implicatum]|nr:hypothetical protein LIA77_04760 [Sarocladium implicatum]
MPHEAVTAEALFGAAAVCFSRFDWHVHNGRFSLWNAACLDSWMTGRCPAVRAVHPSAMVSRSDSSKTLCRGSRQSKSRVSADCQKGQQSWGLRDVRGARKRGCVLAPLRFRNAGCMHA